MGAGDIVIDEGGAGSFLALLRGDIDLTCREALRRLLAQYAVSAEACVVIDLGAVTSLSSTGLSTLSALDEEARRRSGHLRLHNVPADLMPVLSAAGLSVATLAEEVGTIRLPDVPDPSARLADDLVGRALA
jgi:anti-anti-sigma factor